MDISILLFYLFAFAQGCVIGSFINVVIDRMPAGESLWGRSHCDHCGRTLRPHELIPLISYILQRARPTCCKAKLKYQYPAVELLMGCLFFVITAYMVHIHTFMGSLLILPAVMALWTIAAIGVAICFIDFRHHIIPDELQVALIIAATIYQLGMHTFSLSSVIAAFVVASPLLVIYFITRGRGMGFGDVKLQAGMGIWLGIWPGLVGVYFGFLFGALYGVALLFMGRARRHEHIAFGPFLLLGGWFAFIYGGPIVSYMKHLLMW